VPAYGTTPLEAADAALTPIAFVAFTVNVYTVPFVRPVNAMGDVALVPVNAPGLDVTV
jgi:hypothetical protein